MATTTVTAEQLTEGSIVLVRGKLGFARLTRLIEGAELQASDARRAQNNMNPVGVPHTTATLTHADVLLKDPANPTLEERFVAERRYPSRKRPETGANYSIDSKGRNLPVIAIPDGNGKVVQDTSGQELAQGLDVTLVLRTYKPKKYNKRGLALEQIIVNEPVKYYAGNANADELAARGIVFVAPPQAVQAGQNIQAGEAAPVEAAGQVVDAGTGTVIDENGFALPAPAAMVPPAPPVADAAAAPPAQPQAETLEQKLARLEAENDALKDAGSAIGAATAPENPWSDASADKQPAGITFQS
ncbi:MULTISPECIES: hypothetical protein [Arthrobacter]|uniref:Uncharacterized protein n=1 Tax=Arthrobacter terricola TaxID=2547396 RepID=A0A4R5K9I4_9MICC|nr:MULTISPECIES: hypothetical protein [Arthrobacter]MBT8162931.1 hypothetical protein [Arthrobacter sp. GN70]TDF91659.1 hypothetical protein E1809_20275 [Arthrobacter terricola]